MDPTRLLDTRVGNGAAKEPVAPSDFIGLQVTARGGVPAIDVAAVVINVTATAPAAAGFIAVSPSGSGAPTVSNLNFAAGQTIPNLAAVKVGGNGRLSLSNYAVGTVHMIADIAGYFLGSPEDLDEVWPQGWWWEDCGTVWDEILLLSSPGLVFSPEGPLVTFKGETYYAYYPDEAGQVVVTASAEPGYVIDMGDFWPAWVSNGDGTYTGTIQFDTDPCPIP